MGDLQGQRRPCRGLNVLFFLFLKIDRRLLKSFKLYDHIIRYFEIPCWLELGQWVAWEGRIYRRVN